MDDAQETKTQAFDYVRHALAADLGDGSGTFLYNNRAVNLLAGVVERASGVRLDDFAMRAFFEPLGIRNVTWKHDGAGNPLVMSGLSMRASELAKVGQLLLDDGFVDGQSRLSASYIAAMTQPQVAAVDYGLLWWVLRDACGKPDGFAAVGALGQYLVVIPRARIVAVRMRRPLPFEWHFAWLTESLRMADFPQRVHRLARASSCVLDS